MKSRFFTVILLSFIILFIFPFPALAVNPVGVSGNWNMVFSDEFNGTTLNTATWSTLRGATSSYAGYGDPFNPSDEDAYYTPNNVSVSANAPPCSRCASGTRFLGCNVAATPSRPSPENAT